MQLSATATHCNTLRHAATHCDTLQLQNTAKYCNTLQLQHIATHYKTRYVVGDAPRSWSVRGYQVREALKSHVRKSLVGQFRDLVWMSHVSCDCDLVTIIWDMNWVISRTIVIWDTECNTLLGHTLQHTIGTHTATHYLIWHMNKSYLIWSSFGQYRVGQIV